MSNQSSGVGRCLDARESWSRTGNGRRSRAAPREQVTTSFHYAAEANWQVTHSVSSYRPAPLSAESSHGFKRVPTGFCMNVRGLAHASLVQIWACDADEAMGKWPKGATSASASEE